MITSNDIIEKFLSLSTSWNVYLESDKRVRTLHNKELEYVKQFHEKQTNQFIIF